MRQKSGPAKLLTAAVPVIGKWSDGLYLFGAQAVIVSGRPRLTADVDLTGRLRPEDTPAFCADMATRGFELRLQDNEFITRTRVLPFLHTETQLPLDIVLAGPS